MNINKNIKVLIVGKDGQVAWELIQTKPDNMNVIALGIDELDLTNSMQINHALLIHQPDLVINAAAYTAVDKAETEHEIAYAVNEQGPANLALMCKELGCYLIHISTDFIFNGHKSTPYDISDTPDPVNIYGASKLAGEIKVANILGEQASIIRTAWVYSANGNNFVKSMLNLMAARENLGIVCDQVGTPTWAKGLAEMIWHLAINRFCDNPNHVFSADKPAYIYHWTDAGVASWYDFAIAIQELAIEKGLLNNEIPIYPILTSDYPTPAKRPSFSLLNKIETEKEIKINTMHWRKQLNSMLDELKQKSVLIPQNL